MQHQQEEMASPRSGRAQGCPWELPLEEGWMAEAAKQPGRELALEGPTNVPTCPPSAVDS